MAGPRRGKRENDSAKGARILIVEARYYDDLADALLAGAMTVLEKAQAKVERISVPGSLEIPGAIAIAIEAARRKRRPYDGVVALGCVIRGETIHFEIVSQESARGLMALSMTHALPIGNGIITVNTQSQAFARARMEEMDKGGDAARAALAHGASETPTGREVSMARAAAGGARKANKRGAARLAAVQALYQMDLAGTGINEILAEFESHWLGGEVEGAQYLPAEAAFFRDIVARRRARAAHARPA